MTDPIHYGWRGNARLWLAPTVANIAGPTMAEILAAIDITQQVTPDGLNLPADTEEVPRGTWADDLTPTSPGRYGYSGATLRCYHRNANSDWLWNLCTLRTRRFLIKRQGYPYALAPAAGQRLQVFSVQFGKRFTLPSRDGEAVTFMVPLSVRDDSDSAVVV